MWFWYSAVEAHPGGRVAQIKTLALRAKSGFVTYVLE
jgi:hypothetical protein